MSLFKRLSRNPDQETPDEAVVAAPCAHRHLAARWDEPDDIGKEELARGYSCNSCGQMFTPAEAEVVRATPSDHLPGDE